MGNIFKVAITVFAFIFVPYLIFVLPKRVRNHPSARMRYYIFFFTAFLFVIFVVRFLK